MIIHADLDLLDVRIDGRSEAAKCVRIVAEAEIIIFELGRPARTSTAIIARLQAEIGKALADRATHESLLELAMEPIGGSAEQFARLVRADAEKYARLAKDLKIKPD
jgi:tripartite-type tricarboxylate transporter receptor subunit TctC